MKTIRIEPSLAVASDEAVFNNEGEPIYALMITGKDDFHANLACNAIFSFLAQSYRNRYLIIISDGDFCFESSELPQERIVQIHLNENRRSLGTLRNESMNAVPSHAVWIQWDDDDWYHPDLMARQYEMLIANKVEACFLRHQVKYAFEINAGWADSFFGGFAGTVMARQRSELRYADMSRGEDSLFCYLLKQSFLWMAWDNPPHYYLRFIHGHNSWHDEHFQLSRRTLNQRSMSIESATYLESVLPLYTPYFGR